MNTSAVEAFNMSHNLRASVTIAQMIIVYLTTYVTYEQPDRWYIDYDNQTKLI